MFLRGISSRRYLYSSSLCPFCKHHHAVVPALLGWQGQDIGAEGCLFNTLAVGLWNSVTNISPAFYPASCSTSTWNHLEWSCWNLEFEYHASIGWWYLALFLPFIKYQMGGQHCLETVDKLKLNPDTAVLLVQKSMMQEWDHQPVLNGTVFPLQKQVCSLEIFLDPPQPCL